jgi:hypothetical protein
MPNALSPLKSLAALALAGFLAACSSSGAELEEPLTELGDFRLCYNIVTTNDAVQGPFSREADLDVFADSIRDQIDRRFGRYEGTRLYHIAIHIDAYVLAMPGVPLVASPRSALIISVNLWDDALGRPLNEEPKQLTVLESAGGATVLGSGLTQTAEEQMQQLSENAALAIENWMLENPDWFPAPGVAAPATEAETTEETPTETATAEQAAETPEGTTAAEGATGGCGRR